VQMQLSTSVPILLRIQSLAEQLTRPWTPINYRTVPLEALDPRLQYDVSEIDYRPPAAAVDSYERRLFLHKYPR
jgi:hypothetical protein